LDEYVAYCNAKKIAWLDISSYHWYGLDDVDFLRDCPSVTGIHMQGGFASYAGLSTLPQLRSLSVIFEHDIDFAALPHLEDLSTDWNSGVDRGLFESLSLKRLWLSGYKPKTRN